MKKQPELNDTEDDDIILMGGQGHRRKKLTMTKRNLDLICRHCLRSYDEDGRDYGNYGTGLCFKCFEEDQENPHEKMVQASNSPIYHKPSR